MERERHSEREREREREKERETAGRLSMPKGYAVSGEREQRAAAVFTPVGRESSQNNSRGAHFCHFLQLSSLFQIKAKDDDTGTKQNGGWKARLDAVDDTI